MRHPRETQARWRRETRRRPINVLASVLTTFGLYCGIASIFAGIGGNYIRAAYFIGAAIVFDMLDGPVAKLTNSASEFGKELDSLCDLVSFGVAPAVLIYTAFLREGDVAEGSFVEGLGSFIAIVYVICGALRLARYNVYQSQVRDHFTGLPIPAAGGTVAAFVLFTLHYQWHVAMWVLGPLTLVLACLMVSNVRYPKDRLRAFVLSPRNAFRILILCGVGIGVFHFASSRSLAIVLFPMAMTYVSFGLVQEFYARVLRRRKRSSAAPAPQPESVPPGEPPPSKTPEVL